MFYLYESVNYCTRNQCFKRRTKWSNEIGLYQCSFCLLDLCLLFYFYHCSHAIYVFLAPSCPSQCLKCTRHNFHICTYLLFTHTHSLPRHQRALSTRQTQSDRDESRQDLRANSRPPRQDSSRRQQQTKSCTTT